MAKKTKENAEDVVLKEDNINNRVVENTVPENVDANGGETVQEEENVNKENVVSEEAGVNVTEITENKEVAIEETVADTELKLDDNDDEKIEVKPAEPVQKTHKLGRGFNFYWNGIIYN